MTTCLAHPDRAASATCSACAADLCGDCEVRAQGVSWCEACFATRVHAAGSAMPPPLPAGVPLKYPGLAVLFALLVPGLGTIYALDGPAKRGLVQFAVWAMLFWLMIQASGALAFFAFLAWVGFWIWQAVDAHGCARLVNALGRTPSEEEAATLGRGPYLLKNADTRSLGTALLVVGCVLLAIEIGGALLSGLRWFGPLALVAGGAWIVWRARRRPPVASGEPGHEAGLA